MNGLVILLFSFSFEAITIFCKKITHMKNLFSTLFMVFAATGLFAQNVNNNANSNHGNKFEQMGANFPTPNEYRTASGSPGPKYWQQRCDYDIKCELDEKNLKLNGSETVTYFNNSPNPLTYLWLQLDENEHSTINNANYLDASAIPATMNVADIERM